MKYKVICVWQYVFVPLCSYIGHGAGARFLDAQRVLKGPVRAVALLFGCSSAALSVLGHQEEQESSSATWPQDGKVPIHVQKYCVMNCFIIKYGSLSLHQPFSAR